MTRSPSRPGVIWRPTDAGPRAGWPVHHRGAPPPAWATQPARPGNRATHARRRLPPADQSRCLRIRTASVDGQELGRAHRRSRRALAPSQLLESSGRLVKAVVDLDELHAGAAVRCGGRSGPRGARGCRPSAGYFRQRSRKVRGSRLCLLERLLVLRTDCVAAIDAPCLNQIVVAADRSPAKQDVAEPVEERCARIVHGVCPHSQAGADCSGRLPVRLRRPAPASGPKLQDAIIYRPTLAEDPHEVIRPARTVDV